MTEKTYRLYSKIENRFSFLSAIIFFPIFMISLIFPKKKLELYGSMNGFDVADNSKYHYIGNNQIRKVFILKNRSKINQARKVGFNAVYCYSIRGIWCQLVASRVYWSHGINDFFAPLVCAATVVGLQHGAPVKIGGRERHKHFLLLSTSRFKYLKSNLRGLLYVLAPYSNHQYCNISICGEHKFKSYVEDVLSWSKPLVFAEMLPRIQFLPDQKKKKKILYAPTHRPYRSILDTLNGINFKHAEIDKVLNKRGFQLYLRPHPMDLTLAFLETAKDWQAQNIKIDFSSDLYESLKEYALVITDFSSIYQDCVWCETPVLIVCDDLHHYNQSQGLFDWYIDAVDESKETDFMVALKRFFLDRPSID